MQTESFPEDMNALLGYLQDAGVKCLQCGDLRLVEALFNGKRHWLSQFTLPIVPQHYTKLLDNKPNFKALLRHRQIPYVLASKPFAAEQADRALAYAETEIGFPVVLKPVDGETLDSVFINVSSAEEFKFIWSEYYQPQLRRRFTVEAYLPGAADYRFYLFNNYTNAVMARSDPVIVGDGQQSIASLMEKENERRTAQARLQPLLIDEECQRVLKKQAVTLQTVLAEKQSVIVRYGTDVNAGAHYAVIDNSQIHTGYWQLAEELWRIFPAMPCFSVDILSTDITAAPSVTTCAVSEAHVGASVKQFLYPAAGVAVDLHAPLSTLLFPELAKNR